MSTRIAPIRHVLLAATALLASVATEGLAPLRAHAAPLDAGGFTTVVTPATTTIARGQTVTLRLDITSTTTTRALVDVEVYSPSGVKLFQQAWDGEAFVAGQLRTFSSQAAIPTTQALGTYSVKIGIFGTGWSSLLHWNDSAASWRIVPVAPPTTTTAPQASTTTSPVTNPPTTRATTTVPAPTTTRAPVTTLPRPTTPPPASTAPPTTPAPTTVAPTAPPTTPAPTSPPTTAAPTTVPTPTTTSPPANAQFYEDFQSAAGLNRFNWQLHTSGNVPDEHLPIASGYPGEHDMACGGPDTSRTVTGGQAGDAIDVAGSDLIWWCPQGAGHFMTAVDTGQVAVLSFTPKQTFNDVHQVCWEQNMNNLGEGKWPNLFIIPRNDVARHGGALHYSAGPSFGLDPSEFTMPAGAFNFTWIRGSLLAFQGTGDGYTQILDQWGSTDDNMEPTGGPRHPICVTDLENGNIRYDVYQTAAGSVQSYTQPGSFPDGAVNVIFQDGSYNPNKHAGTGHLTWHWDNISIS